VGQGKDDLAREALRRKRDAEENGRVYGDQLTAQQQTVTRLKNQLQDLENKLDQMQSKRDALIARSRRAKAQQQVSETISNLPNGNASTEFERFERRIRTTEARAAASAEVAELNNDDEFAKLDQDFGVEDELAALKSKRSGATTAAVPSAAPSGGASAHDDDLDADLAALKAKQGGQQ